jgi:uncharacterized sulfatase
MTGLSVLVGTAQITAQAHRPNIVLLYTDDQAYWAVGANGNPEIHTPNLDRLFLGGARFNNAFVVTPVCSPSRVGLIASRWGFEVGVTDWINPRTEENLGLDPAIVTWPEVLAEAGYVNGLVGKWHLGTQPRFHPHRVGYEHFMGFLSGGTRPMKPELEIDGVVKELSASLPDVLVDDAIRFVERNRDRRFTMSVHFRAPHAPYHPVPSTDSAHYVGKTLTVPDAYPGLDGDEVRRLTREYYGSVSSVDRNVGRLLDALDALDLSSRTIVLFTSDHGYNIGHHGIRHKGNARWIVAGKTGRRPNMYDTSIRIPTAVRWPGVVEPGQVIDRTVSNLDFYPTILAMAGVKLPDGVKIHGRDFTPLLRGDEVGWDDTLFGAYDMHHGFEARMRMIRTPSWKLVRHYGAITPPDELYHLAADPDEHLNLIDVPAHRTRAADLQAQLLAWQTEVQDPLLTATRK